MTIIGESEQGTIINGTGINWIFNITSGTNVTLCNLTLTNGFTSDFGGAIQNRGNLNAKNCTFTDNTASNTDWGRYGWGGAICNREGSSTITGCTFKNNSANTGGALSNSLMTSGSMTSTVTDCTFTGNIALVWGGAIENYGYYPDLTANYNKFYKNIAPEGSAIFNSDGNSADVESNWWGSNNPTSIFSSLIEGTSAPKQWLYMTINATPQTINNTQTSLIIVSFNNRYNGTAVTPYIPGVGEYIPDGTSVTFSLIEGIFGPYGTLTGPLTVGTSNGIASILFTASRAGIQEINASTDDENVTATVTINPTADLYIQITSDKKNPRVGEIFTLTYKLGNNGPDDATNVTITIPIPEGFHISSITGDGTWNIVGNNIIWTFNNVTVGDPYLYITGWTTAAGNYIFTASISSNTFNLNSRGVNFLSINAQPQVNAATTNTVGMQKTGSPLAGIVLAILMVLGGYIGTQKKQ